MINHRSSWLRRSFCIITKRIRKTYLQNAFANCICIAYSQNVFAKRICKSYSHSVFAKHIHKAPGPSSLRPSHLREAVACPSPDRAHEMLSALTKFINLLAAGQVPSSIRPYLCGATLLACKKKNGGLHPIAVGEVLRRLVSKCLTLVTGPASLSELAPCSWVWMSKEVAKPSFMLYLIS